MHGELTGPIVEEFPTREAWLEGRRFGIGGSEAAAACGRSPWYSRLDLWMRKRGLHEPCGPSVPMRVGKVLEDLLLDLYSERLPDDGCWAVVGWPQTKLMRSREYPWMTCTPDATHSDGRLIELKTTMDTRDWGEPGSDQIPLHYLIQVHHQMIVAGVEICDVGVLLKGSDFRVYTVPLNPDLAESIVSLEREFWGYVERCEPPPEESPTPLQLAKLNPECEGEVDLDGDIETWVDTYHMHGETIKAVEVLRDQCKSKILQAMGSHKIGRLSSGAYVRRFLEKHQERVQTVREHTRHYFRIVGPREESE